MPEVSAPTWQAIFAPPKTPREIVNRLSREVASALHGADLRTQFARQLLQIEGSTPEALAALIQADYVTWKQFIRDNDIVPE
jgi:tripartite-type tricarboxylate transporter receptor subunit TctC